MGQLRPRVLNIPEDNRNDIIDTLFPKQGKKMGV